MTFDVPTKDNCPVCSWTMFKKSGKGYKRPYCINESCANFLPEEKRGYVKKTADAKKDEDKSAKKTTKKTAAKKTAAKKTTAKKTTAKKTAAKKTVVKKAAPKKAPVKKTVSKKPVTKYTVYYDGKAYGTAAISTKNGKKVIELLSIKKKK